MTENPFEGAELVVEYETGHARRAIAFRVSDAESDAPYDQEEWAYGADGWSLNGTRPAYEFTLEFPTDA